MKDLNDGKRTLGEPLYIMTRATEEVRKVRLRALHLHQQYRWSRSSDKREAVKTFSQAFVQRFKSPDIRLTEDRFSKRIWKVFIGIKCHGWSRIINTFRSEMEYRGYISHLNYTYEKITRSNESLAVVRARMSSEGEKITTLWHSAAWHKDSDMGHRWPMMVSGTWAWHQTSVPRPLSNVTRGN